jgi:hypothetical protein
MSSCTEHGQVYSCALCTENRLGAVIDTLKAENTRLNVVLDRLADETTMAGNWNMTAEWLGKEFNARIEYARNRGADEEIDPTPWCSGCGAIEAEQCECGPICENN